MRPAIVIRALSCLTLLALAAGGVSAQVETREEAVVLHGSPANCSQPATIDYAKVARKTPEHKTIEGDNVRKDSARYNLLMTKLKNRVKNACQKVAKDGGHDCVVREGDIKDERGRAVKDITDDVIAALESVSDNP
jgi:hypothetical protein